MYVGEKWWIVAETTQYITNKGTKKFKSKNKTEFIKQI